MCTSTLQRKNDTSTAAAKCGVMALCATQRKSENITVEHTAAASRLTFIMNKSRLEWSRRYMKLDGGKIEAKRTLMEGSEVNHTG